MTSEAISLTLSSFILAQGVTTVSSETFFPKPPVWNTRIFEKPFKLGEEKMKRERRIVVKKCPFCACEFVTDHDLELHMKAFGNDREEHARRLRYLDYRGDPGRAD